MSVRTGERAAARVGLVVCAVVAASVGGNRGGENPQVVEQWSAAECAAEIDGFRRVAWDSSVEQAQTRRSGVMVATTVAVHANCKDAIHADSERCRRIGAELVAEPRRRPEMVKTWGMPDEEQPDVMEEVGRLRKKGVYPVECEWAVIDAVANPMAAGFNLP